MPRKGLCQEDVVRAAVSLVEETGLARFSLGELARRLEIKTASLYNHVENLEHLRELVGHEAVSQLVQAETQAVRGKQGDAALFALAEAYRAFAREHCPLYQVIMAFPKWGNPTLEQEAGEILAPIRDVLAGYGLTETQQFHWQRVLRSVMAGFAFHEQAGGFSQFPAEKDESYRIAIQCVAEGLRRAGGKQNENQGGDSV